MSLCVSRLTIHDNNMNATPNTLGTRLVTITTMTIPPHHMAIIPIAPSSQSTCSTNITTELIKVIEKPLLHIEQPCLCILDTLHKFYDEDENKCIMMAANISDEELGINKGITTCFVHVADVTEVHHNAEHIELILLLINYYLTELLNESKQQLNDILEEFSDIMSKISKDIGLTHLEEMVLPTEPGAVPVASKPYDLTFKHHKFVIEELTNLLEADLIERSLSPYTTPIIVVPHKAPPESSLTETKRLVIDYHELNKQLPKNSSG